MFDLINGLPIHPLVVHGVVVLLPLAIVGTIAIAARSSWRAKYGYLVLAITAVATALIPIATSSGEALEKRVGDPGNHAALGDQLIWFALPMLVLVAGLVFLNWRSAHRKAHRGAHPGDAGSSTTSSRTWLRTVAALAVVAALATGVQVYRVGDSGARAAWGDQVSAQGR